MTTAMSKAGYSLALGFIAVAVGAVAAFAPLFAIAVLVGAALIILGCIRPQIAMVAWLLCVIFIPNWTPIPAGPFGSYNPTTAIGIPILIGIGLAAVLNRNSLRLHWMDFTLVAGGLLILLQAGIGFADSALVKMFALLWVIGYIFGRLATPQVQRVFVRALVVVAVWGILELLLDIHVFENWATSANHHWNEIQTRAGFNRSEGPFGHAISYGAVLAMGIPLAHRLPRCRVAAQIILAVGVICSFSRGPLGTLVVALILSALVLNSVDSRTRRRLFFVAVAGSGVAWFVMEYLYKGEDSARVVQSGEQRSNQYNAVLDTLNWLDPATGFGQDGDRYVVGGVAIIDSTPLRLAVNFGIIAAVLLLMPILVAAWRVVTFKAGVASVAVVTQIPVLIVTSLITQWAVLVFFAMGMAVSEVARSRLPRLSSEQGPHADADDLAGLERAGRSEVVEPVSVGITRVQGRRSRG